MTTKGMKKLRNFWTAVVVTNGYWYWLIFASVNALVAFLGNLPGNFVVAGLFLVIALYRFILIRRIRDGYRASTEDLVRRARANTATGPGQDAGPPYITVAGAGEGKNPFSPNAGLVARLRASPLYSHSDDVPYSYEPWQRTGGGVGSRLDPTLGLVPDSQTPFIGFRSWSWDGKLRPLTFSERSWHPGVNSAQCDIMPFPHLVGDQACSCGFYALKRFRGYGPYGDSPFSTYVSGVVELFGVVTECTEGYRASHARVLAFIGQSPSARDAASAFNVPLLAKPPMVV